MKQFTFICPLLFFLINLSAQSSLPEFGKVDKAELEMATCDFDKNAEAVVLFDEGEFYYEVNFGLERRTRIKILKDKGLDYANIHVRYLSFLGEENVKGITAQTYNLDAAGNIVVTKLDKKLIYDKKLNKRYSEVAFSLPEVKAGSVIEYKYRIEGAFGRRWYFQQSIPVIKSRYVINFPETVEMSAVPNCILNYNSTIERKSGRDLNVYTMENVPALRDEAYISCDDDYLQSIDPRVIAISPFGKPRQSFVRTWPGIIRQLMDDEDFGMQLKRNIPRTKDLDSMLLLLKSPYEKMTTIHGYVKKNMEWDGSDNIWALDGVKSAWKDKKGTSGEINLILVNLLKDAGLNAHPVLVSTKNNGVVNALVPSWSQFNKVMAVVDIDEQKYVLDAVEKFTPSKLIPEEVSATQGLVIEKIDTGEWGWVTLWDDKSMFTNTVFINGTIDTDGVLKATAEITSDGYARVKRMPLVQDGKKVFTEKLLTSQNEGVKIDSVVWQDEKVDSLPLLQKVSFNQQLSGTGDYKYFHLNLFTGLEKNPFIADNRFSDVFFGYNQRINVIATINIPEGYLLEELPKNVKMIMPDTGIIFKRFASLENNELGVRVSLDFKKPIYTIEEYPEFKEFYKKLFDLLNEQYVLRKKN
jgi:hypothetical protein